MAPQEKIQALLDEAQINTDDRLKRIIFFTSSEYGQANVFLAVIHELLLRQVFEIHIASFAPLKKRIDELNLSIPINNIPARFHTVTGRAALEALTAKNEFIGPFPPGVKGAINTYRITLPAMATTWDGPEYMEGYASCLDMLRSIEADLIVVDPLMSQGLEAATTLSQNYVVLSPNTFQEILPKQQPVISRFCVYPAICSAFPYPVPWHLILANIYLKIAIVFILITSTKVKDLMSFRKSQNLPGMPPSFNIWKKENYYLLPSTLETEYPHHVPSNVTPCGPILLPVTSVSIGDPKLYAWLKRGPTVLVNLGSHIRMDENMAQAFAVGLKILLDKQPDIQVLWKLKTTGGLSVSSKAADSGFQGQGLSEGTLEAISQEIANGRVKILEWLSVDPLAIMQSGHVVVSVHHGGSNSFHEALSAGVPQIILPCWLDTLDFANRIEWLGIGVFGSRSAAPGVEAVELSQALMKVLGHGEEADAMKERAKELAESCGKVGGRVKACEKIIEILGST